MSPTLAKTMRALTLPSPPYLPGASFLPKDLTYHSEHPIPSLPSHYIIAVSYTALTRSELTWSEVISPRRTTASIPGHDVVGTIIALPGSSATFPKNKFKVGDIVYAMICGHRDGAAASYVSCPESELALVPNRLIHDDKSLAEAASIPLSVLSAWQGLFEHGGLEPPTWAEITKRDQEWVRKQREEIAKSTPRKVNPAAESNPSDSLRVLVTGGSGGVGVMVLQILRALNHERQKQGSSRIEIVTTCSNRNADFVRELGADHVIDYTAFPDLITGVQSLQLSSSGPFDLVLDTVGGATLTESRSAEVIKIGGKIVTVAHPLPAEERTKLGLGLEERNVTCIFFIVRGDGEQLSEIGQWVEEGKIEGIVDGVWDLKDGAQAMEKVESRRVRGKIVLRVEGI